jgi:hypothetical protein
MSRNINDAQLQELHRWQKWVLADRMAQHGVTVLSQEPDGGIVLGKGAVTARIPGAATVAQALRCAESGLLDLPLQAERCDRIPFWVCVLLWLLVAAIVWGGMWLGGIFLAAEGAYHYGEGMR